VSRILYIHPFLPLRDRDSGSLRLYRILQLLREDGHQISYLPHTIWSGHESYAHDLVQQGIEVLAPPDGTQNDLSVRTALSGREFDTVIISFHNFAASYTPFVRHLCPSAKIIVDTIDLHFVRERRQAQTTGDPALTAKAEQTYQAEIASYAAADALVAISPPEKEILQKELPQSTIHIVPNVHELEAVGPGYESRSGLLFVGNFWHPPNGEGITWFCQEVWPRIIRRLPTMTLDIVGQDPPPDLMRYAGPQIQIHGWVQSLDSFLKTKRVSIAPLLHGAGLKGKVGEALAAGLPVVTTSVGAEGLNLRDSQEAMVADSAKAFADAVVTAHEAPELWQRLAENGRRLISQTYTPEAVRAAVRSVVPPDRAPAAYFGVPDWNDEASLRSTTRAYIERHLLDRDSALTLGVFDFDTGEAFNRLSAIITSLGYDPTNIPDISLVPLASLDFRHLDPAVLWVPMRDDVSQPSHLQVLVMSAN
jgi:O-antigen biosynthesis protein